MKKIEAIWLWERACLVYGASSDVCTWLREWADALENKEN